jgi:ribonuclease D
MINTAAELKTLTQRACESPRVALDTEFLWERTFYPRLGVVQIGFTERECYLVDAVALPTLPGLGELLETRETEKILHDALQDLTILARATGATPRSVFDTRRAAGFCATASTASLLSLLREIMNIEIPKTEQRSNWLRRPLSHKQIAYALNDVRFLPGLRDALVELAEKNGNLAYLNEEMGLFDAHDLYQDPSPEDVFQRERAQPNRITFPAGTFSGMAI